MRETASSTRFSASEQIDEPGHELGIFCVPPRQLISLGLDPLILRSPPRGVLRRLRLLEARQQRAQTVASELSRHYRLARCLRVRAKRGIESLLALRLGGLIGGCDGGFSFGDQ